MSQPPLWKHQQECLEKSKTVSNLALFHDLGTGKSRTTIEILRDKFNTNKKVLRTLILCPSSILEKWKREIVRYSSISATDVHVLSGTLLERAEMYAAKEGIFITNRESFAFDKFTSVVLKYPPNICVVDESHSFKDITAKRTKALVKVSYEMEKLPVHHRYILTGSPVLNTQMDLFSQFLFLDCGATFGKNFFAFRATYFQDKNQWMPRQKHFPNWVPRTGADEQLKQKIAPVVSLADKKLCLDLPELLRTEVEVTLSPEQKKSYEELKKDFITYVEGKGAVVANLAITKMLRMMQALSGFLKLENGDVHRFKQNPRADVLSELLEDKTIKEKCIIWAVYHEDFQTIKNVCNKLKLEYAEVTGLVKDKEAQLQRFDKDPSCRVMIASQSAGGVGCEMIEASVAIYYSKGHSLEHDFQSEARNFRSGSEKHAKITRIDLVARGTLDEAVLQALRDKKDLARNILALKDMLKTETITA